MAQFAQRRHLLIEKFLRILGIEEKKSATLVEGIEHDVHKDTLNRIQRASSTS
jgi:Mn-dependent DtxR family transcriptional regulator